MIDNSLVFSADLNLILYRYLYTMVLARWYVVSGHDRLYNFSERTYSFPEGGRYTLREFAFFSQVLENTVFYNIIYK